MIQNLNLWTFPSMLGVKPLQRLTLDPHCLPYWCMNRSTAATRTPDQCFKGSRPCLTLFTGRLNNAENKQSIVGNQPRPTVSVSTLISHFGLCLCGKIIKFLRTKMEGDDNNRRSNPPRHSCSLLILWHGWPLSAGAAWLSLLFVPTHTHTTNLRRVFHTHAHR